MNGYKRRGAKRRCYISLHLSFILIAIFVAIVTGQASLNLNWRSYADLYLVTFLCYLVLFHFKFRIIGFGLGVYFITSFLYAVTYKGIYYLDFIQAYKFVVIFTLLFMFNVRFYGDKRAIGRLLDAMIIVFFLWYAVDSFIFNERPHVFLENNYELMFVILFLGLRTSLCGKPSVIILALVSAIFILSTSRSASISLLFYFLIYYSKADRTVIIKLVGGVILAYAVFTLFQARLGDRFSYAEVDRVIFFNLFLEQAYYHSWSQWLFGTERITDLDQYICNALIYYSKLFSLSGDDKCYSVVLHSMNLRLVFDHGIFGLLLSYGLLFGLLKRSTMSSRLSIFVTGSLFISGMSVSGFNDGLMMIPVLFTVISGSTVAIGLKQN